LSSFHAANLVFLHFYPSNNQIIILKQQKKDIFHQQKVRINPKKKHHPKTSGYWMAVSREKRK